MQAAQLASVSSAHELGKAPDKLFLARFIFSNCKKMVIQQGPDTAMSYYGDQQVQIEGGRNTLLSCKVTVGLEVSDLQT